MQQLRATMQQATATHTQRCTNSTPALLALINGRPLLLSTPLLALVNASPLLSSTARHPPLPLLERPCSCPSLLTD
eukprot:357723-Chlamydomonas_euryale.AAC.14